MEGSAGEEDAPNENKLAKFIRRVEWGAASPRRVTDLKTPVQKVLTCWADVEPCFTTEDCMQRCRDIQIRHMRELKLADIQHHFMVGGDGNIYEGRGWYNLGITYPSELDHAEELTAKSIEIAFLEKQTVKPSPTLMKAASDCIAFGLVAKYLKEKLQFFWRTPGKIEFISTYETNAPGSSGCHHFSDAPNSPSEERNEKLLQC